MNDKELKRQLHAILFDGINYNFAFACCEHFVIILETLLTLTLEAL